MNIIKSSYSSKIILLVAMTLLTDTALLADDIDGMVRIKSAYDVNTTIDKLENALKSKGMTIFKRVDHTAGATKAGIQLRPTELLIFGNPKVGTPLMLCSQTAALDLPQKALAYEDEKGLVWLVYNDPAYMAKRHDTKGCEKAIQKVSNALAKFAGIATK